ncbi:hypothetical protein N7456_001320 [Penicillium angulare]|uniref:Uncharacterized protein n=1 Tax=Penicillium angulare TaxID=116970 RepID=A0A9W9KRR8_9EURO|nr:hypothetical protein N7456_001320 [Penicillium angulare]
MPLMRIHVPAGPMARRLTTNQEIAGSTPASVNLFAFDPFDPVYQKEFFHGFNMVGRNRPHYDPLADPIRTAAS